MLRIGKSAAARNLLFRSKQASIGFSKKQYNAQPEILLRQHLKIFGARPNLE